MKWKITKSLAALTGHDHERLRSWFIEFRVQDHEGEELEFYSIDGIYRGNRLLEGLAPAVGPPLVRHITNWMERNEDDLWEMIRSKYVRQANQARTEQAEARLAEARLEEHRR